MLNMKSTSALIPGALAMYRVFRFLFVILFLEFIDIRPQKFCGG
jgi:hypothetical protein